MSSEAVPSKFISLVPTNGNQFSGSSGQKIIFELEPSSVILRAEILILILR